MSVRITQNDFCADDQPEFGQWYVSRTDDDDLPRYLRRDGTWHRMMRDLGGTYFKARKEAEQMVKEWCQ